MKEKLYVLCIVVVFVLCACSGKSSETSGSAKTEEITHITIVTATSGSVNEVIGAAMAEMLNKNIKGITFTSVPSTGTAVNANLLQQGDAEVAFLQSDIAIAAAEGTDPFKEKIPGLRSVFALHTNNMQIWARSNLGINDFGDLKSKRFTHGRPGTAPWQPGLSLMKVYGFSEDDVKKAGGDIVPLTWNEACTALQDGNLDAVLWVTATPAPRIVDVQMTKELTMIQINPAKLDAFKKELGGWSDITIPKSTYKGQNIDINTIGVRNFIAVTDKLPDDVVYKITKTLWENREQLGIVVADLKSINSDTVTRGMMLPLHNGAKKYFTEAGIPTN